MIVPEHGAARWDAQPDKPSGCFEWGRSLASRYDSLHEHVSPSGSVWSHRHVNGTEEHYHEPYRDLSDLGTDELQRELVKRGREAARQRKEAAAREAQLARERQEAREAELLRAVGLTREQLDLVRDYLASEEE